MTTRRARHLAMSLCTAIALAGCDPTLPPPPAGSTLTAETIATRAAPPEHHFQGVLAGKPVHLLLYECRVYRVEDAAGGNVTWTQVLAGDPYPLPTSCVNQSITAEKGGVTAFLGRQAFGAGGCCVGTPEFRTKDGVTWTPR